MKYSILNIFDAITYMLVEVYYIRLFMGHKKRYLEFI